MLRLFFVFALLVFPFSVFAQNDDDAVKERLRQQNLLLEQILADAKNLRLPENRALVFAKVGNALWQRDEKRARELFQSSIADLTSAQIEAETEKGNKQQLNNLIYGQQPRWEILNAVAARDAEFALDAMVKTRPEKVAQSISALTSGAQPANSGFARNEIQGEQRLIAIAADQNPQRAIKLLRESLKKDVSYETLNLLRKIFDKEPETANRLAEEAAQKLLAAKFNEDNQDTGTLQNFLNEFGRKKTDETPALKVSDQTLRNLAEKYAKYLLRPTTSAGYINSSTLETIEKYDPSGVALIKQKQAQAQNQAQNAQSQNYNKLMSGEATTEELLGQAEKFPRYLRNEIYRRAAEKTAAGGNVVEAQKIIASNLTEEEAANYLSQMNYNLANQAISQGKFEDAEQIINQITDDNLRLNTLIYLANAIYQKDPKENQKRAATILSRARSFISDTPEKTSEINLLINIAAAYIPIEPAQSFRIVETLSAPLNEFSEASAVIAKYNDYGNLRQGEYPISAGNNLLGVYSLIDVLQRLETKDFDRTFQFINGFSRLDVRLCLEMQLIDLNPTNNSAQMRPMIFSSGYHQLAVDKK